MKSNSKIGVSYPKPIFEPSARSKEILRKRAKTDPVSVMSQIIRNQHSLYTKEISHWKIARAEAENLQTPRRTALYDLYDDIALDPFLIGVTNKRKLKVTNKPWIIQNTDTKDKDEDLTRLLNKEWFREFIKLAMDSHYYGYSLPYLWSTGSDGLINQVKLVPRKHVRPQSQEWVKHESDISGFKFTENPFYQYMIGIGKEDNLGLYNPAAPLYILKKHSWASWDEFEEIFGVPIRTAEVASNDPTVRAEILHWLKTMGSASYGMFPPDAKLDIKESNQSDAFEVFNEKRKAVNEELEIMILGVKNASQEAGTYGKQKAIGDEQDEVQVDDMTWIGNIINDELLPRLRRLGYPISDHHCFVWDETNWMDPKEKIKVYESLDRMGYNLDEDQLSADLNVTINGRREVEPTKPKPKAEPKDEEDEDIEAKSALDVMAKLRKDYFT